MPNTAFPLRFAALAGALALCAGPVAAAVPALNRVVVVIMENKSYDQVRTQPYTMSLMAGGATLTNSYGTSRPSQPNYFSLWAGSTLGVTVNNCAPPGTPFTDENLGHACEVAGKTWRAYSENLAFVGSTTCSYDGSASSGLYTRKHAPWTNFINIDHTRERPYSDLAGDIAAGTVPNLVFIVPNNCHNSHNSTTSGCGVPNADAWLAANMPAVLGALGPNGVLILTWDEDDGVSGNHVLTVLKGAKVIPGATSAQLVNHHTVVRTITQALGLPSFGLAAGETPIDGIWVNAVATRPESWGRLKLLYR